MNDKNKKWLEYVFGITSLGAVVIALLSIAVAATGYFGVRYPLPEMPEYIPPEDVEDMELYAVGPTRFRKIYVDHEATVAGELTASGGVTGDVTGNVTGNVTGDLTGDMTGDLTNSLFLTFAEQTAISVTVQAYITPTGTYQPLTSAAAVSTSLTTAIMSGTVAGELLVLTNENASDAITIVDGANTAMGGDKVLTGGQGDSIFLYWDGTDWCCIGYNDN